MFFLVISFMKKLKIISVVLLVMVLSCTFWAFVSIKVIKTVVNKEDLTRYAEVLYSRYEAIKYSGIARNEDSSVVLNQNLYDVQNYKLKFSFDRDTVQCCQ